MNLYLKINIQFMGGAEFGSRLHGCYKVSHQAAK